LDGLKRLIDGARSKDHAADPDATCPCAFEHDIATALTHLLEHSVPADPLQRIGRPQLSRPRVIATALALMNAHEGQPIFIDDLCRATKVSERALRNIFHEFFAVGPMRLLKVRQLHEIRAALLRMQPRDDTVTQVAARFGMFDPSLLARNYKALFGESPSRTLHRSPTDAAGCMRAGWIRLASGIFLEEDSNSM
jgi:AraC-like DNA-binding protein